MSKFFDSERFESVIEVIIAIILGLGATFGAFSGFQASLYGSMMDKSYNEATQNYIDAGSAITDANGTMINDMIAYIEIKKTELGYEYSGADSEEYYDRVLNEIIPYITNQDLLDAIIWADEMNASDPDGPNNDGEPYSFYDHEYYGASSIDWYLEAVEAAAQKFVQGNEYNTLGDLHAQYSSMYAISLFLTGLSAVLKKPRIRFTLNIFSGVILVLTAILMFQVPIVMP